MTLYSRLEHTRIGSGTPLVLIHGIGHRREAWEPVVSQLAEKFEVFAIDLAGFGRSPSYGPRVPYTMDVGCSNLQANFAEWGIEHPHVAGNSLGGAIALELGARGLASSVTALSPAGFFRRADRLIALGVLLGLKASSYLPGPLVRAAVKPAGLRRTLGRALYEHGDRISPEEFFKDTEALRNGSAFFDVLKQGVSYAFGDQIDVPTTIAWGTRDKILLYGQSGRAQERLPAARHIALPGCGHVPMIDDPQLVVSTIEQTAQLASPAVGEHTGSVG